VITCKQLVDDSCVEIRFAREVKDLHGAKVSYSLDGKSYRPCAMYRGRDTDSMLECSFWEWNQAVDCGNLKFNGRPHTVYWHLYLNGLHEHKGTVHVRVEALRGDEITTWNETVTLRPGRAVFLNDWKTYVGNQTGWKAQNDSLAVEPKVEVSPVRIPVGVAGRYDVYIGIGWGTFAARLKISDEANRYPFVAPINRPEFQDKSNKEILWKTAELRKDSAIEICPTFLTVREPQVSPFGAVRYIKLVPARKKAAPQPRWADKKLALYFEPWSWAFCYGLNERRQMREALSLYREMGADEIHSQYIRFGSQAIYYSRIAEHHDKGEMLGDEGVRSPGPTEMVRKMDVLRECVDICRELGLTHYANAGLTNCYPGSELEDRISREHPDWRDGSILRFNRPETRDYAAGVIREYVEWGTDAVAVDCMRYPYHHTEEDLLALFAEIHKAIVEQAAGRTVPLTARIPAGDITYFRVFERLARQGIVQCVIPSGLMHREPWLSLKPYLKWRDHGCRIYGVIDGWLGHMGTFNNCQISLHRNPRDIREDITRFFHEGADGIFVYQADQHMADAVNRMVFDWNHWPAGRASGKR
jgi:hypothetical protein